MPSAIIARTFKNIFCFSESNKARVVSDLIQMYKEKNIIIPERRAGFYFGLCRKTVFRPHFFPLGNTLIRFFFLGCECG